MTAPDSADRRDVPERVPAEAFQSEDGERLRSASTALAMHIDSGPPAAYQHEDEEPLD